MNRISFLNRGYAFKGLLAVIDCGFTLDPPRFAEAVLTNTHNVYFGAKIRTIGIPLQNPVFLYKSVV